jgi:hypothetical protein
MSEIRDYSLRELSSALGVVNSQLDTSSPSSAPTAAATKQASEPRETGTNMKRILILDDWRIFDFPKDEVLHARDVTHAREALMTGGHWDELWLDYSLGYDRDDGIPTAMPLVDELEERFGAFDIGTIFIHTQNGYEAEKMLNVLMYSGYKVYKVSPEPYLKYA